MNPISLILTALVAGAAKTAGSVAQDAYNGLKALIKHKFESQGKSASATILDMYEQKPEVTKSLLASELTQLGADKDEEIIKLAQKLMEQLNSQGAADSKVTNISAKNIGVGQMSGGNVTQTFS